MNNHFATRRVPLHAQNGTLGQHQRIETIEIREGPAPINLNSITDSLLKDEEYIDHINEPSPYDHLQNMNTDIVPYLLVFSNQS